MSKSKSILPLSVGVVFAIFMVIGCRGNANKQDVERKPFKRLEHMEWMLGDWQNASEEGSFIESWKVLNDSVYAGSSAFMQGKDTLFIEHITIEQRGNDIYYIPVVPNQNNGEPVIFKRTLSQVKNKVSYPMVIFENPSHNFPQQIKYWQPTQDSLIAEISGLKGAEAERELFPMKRIK